MYEKLNLIWTFYSLLQIEYMDIQVLAHIFLYSVGKQKYNDLLLKYVFLLGFIE